MITVSGLSKTYRTADGAVEAVRSMSFGVAAGEYIAIVGASGSGKSTLMNLLGLIDRPDGGHYSLQGTDINRLSDRRMAKLRNRAIGFVFQNYNLIPGLTAQENVELPLLYRGDSAHIRRTKALRALEDVGLADRRGHRPTQLSGGQQQRVAIARAIVGEPPLILADEPTGNLDKASGGIVLDILERLNTDGATLVLITHDMAVARRAQRILVINDGALG